MRESLLVAQKLSEYRQKRDPEKTPEPFTGKKAKGKPIFVIQRHDARRLHYDFRLEENGALRSWAVPKGVPMRRGDRRLAVHGEGRPLGYATIELHGSRLNGLWTLIPAHMDGDPKNWLLMRKDGGEPSDGRVPRPMLAQLAEKPPEGDGWQHEVKLDGFRAIAT